MKVLTAVVNTNTSGDNQIVAGVATKIIRVLNFVLIPNSAVVTKFTDGAGGAALTGPMSITTQGLWPGWVTRSPAGWTEGHFQTSPGNDLTLNLGTGVQISGYVNYALFDT